MANMPLRYPFPNNPDDFETLCLMLFRVHWGCENLEKYARRGQGQSGIDLIGNDKQGRVCAIQCKHRDFSSALTKREVLKEIESAEKAEPALSRYAIATTAKRDPGLQKLAAASTEKHAADGRFTVEILSWDDLVLVLNEHPGIATEIYGTGPLSRLHQLPAPPADFTGRDAELTQLREAIKKGSVLISGLRGMGGIGKTALALKLADELKKDYPDAQTHLDLLGTAARPEDRVTPEKAMEHVIRAFHPDARLPEDKTQIAALYRSVLSDKRALLLMDNAFDAAQVAPLVPPPGNLMLVTSRQTFHVSGCFAIDLDVLPMPDAKALLLAICPRIAESAESLATACGCLPLALRLAAGALAARKRLNVKAYIDGLGKARSRIARLDEFKDSTDAEKTLEAAFTESYRLLTTDQSAFWRRLAVFVGHFDAAAAAAVTETDESQAAKFLDDLTFFNLVDCIPGTTRCRLHDLARDFAASKLGDCPQWRFLKGY